MTQKIIGLGDPDKGNGDPLRTAFGKVNDNFTELYTLVGVASLTELAQDYAAKMFTDGTHVGVTVEYDDLGNVINLTSLGQTSSGETAPVSPTAGTLWWDSVSGRLYVYYGTSWVDASPVDGAGISSTNELVNGNKTVSLGTEGKLTLPAGTTFEYINAPLTGHGDGLARLDFSLVTNGVDAEWMAASASPAGSGYSPGDTFTFDAEFLGIPGASVTIEVITVGVGGSVENLAFTPPPLYPADIYRDSPINLQVGTTSSNRWTFGATGDLTVPGGIKFTDGLTVKDSAIGRATSNTISEEIPGGFISSTTAIANQITIDTTDSISIERTITQTVYDGVVTATDIAGSSVVVDSTNAYIKHFVEPDGPNNSSYFQVRTGNSGAIIEGVNDELAGSTIGRVTATQGVVDISTSFEGVDKHWLFDMTGDLVVPGPIAQGNSKLEFNANGGTNVYLTPTLDDSTAVFINDISVQAYARESVGLQVGAGLAALELLWTEAEQVWVDVRDQDAAIIAPATRPWAGLPSYQAYDIILNTFPVEPAAPGNLVPAANDAKNAYNTWQTAKSDTTISMAVSDKVWVFDADGKITLPNNGAIRVDGSNIEVGTINNFNVEAAGVVNVYTNTNGVSTYQWQFGDNGGLIFPNTTVQTTAYIPPTTGNSIIGSQDLITISRNGMTIRITAAGVVQMSFDSVIDIKGRSSINNAGSTTIATPNGDTVIGTWYDISTALALGDQLVSTIMDSSFHNVYRITVLIREQDTTPGVEFTTAYAIIEQIQ